MTERIYYADPTVEHSATIMWTEPHEDGTLVVLDRTPFHPQGGGQPADRGTISGVSVEHVFVRGDEICHLLADAASLHAGQRVVAHVDPVARVLHARYHTAGHLIAAVAEGLSPMIATRGHHWPNEAKVEFEGTIDGTASFSDALSSACVERVERGAPVTVSLGDVRMVEIAGFAPQPCGGTHLGDLREIGVVEIRSVGVKKGLTIVKYRVA